MPYNPLATRAQIEPKYTWNAESIFASSQAWETEFESVTAGLPAVRAFEDHLAQGPGVLADALKAIEDLLNRTRKLAVYASLSYSVDTTNQDAMRMLGRARDLYGQAMAATAFLNPELLAVGRPTLEAWMGQEPRLAIYAHMFDDLFRRQAHVRSAEVEEVLGLLADPFSSTSQTFQALTNSDFTFPPAVDTSGTPVPLTQGNRQAILDGPDREARRTAWENYADTYLAFKNTLASNLISAIKQKILQTRVQRYPSTLAMALFEDNIPTEVFHNLLDTFRRHLPVWHRYWSVRRQALEVDVLHPYDIWAPLNANQPSVSFEQAVSWICDGLAPLGQAYVQAIRKGCLEERWVDVYPSQGKTSGAFSSGAQGTFPFIVMNYADSILSLGTLAHELGHSMHSYLTWQSQPFVYSDYTIFAAEVASNFHQAMLRAHLLENSTDPALQIAVIEEAMANFHRYFLVMPTLARFELEIHQRLQQGQGLTADSMIDLLADLMSEGYGAEMHVDRRRVGIQWATFPHLYASYYVFQYATGISGAHALANRVRSGQDFAVDAYLSFLQAGGSMYPLDALRMAGVDLATPQPVEETFAVLVSLIDRLEALVLPSQQPAA